MFYKVYFRNRSLQLARLFKEIGIIRSTIISLLGIWCFLFLYVTTTKYLVAGVFGIIIYLLHSTREDKKHLLLYKKPVLPVYWIEYTFLFIPFMSILLVKKDYYELISGLVIILLAPFLFNITLKRVSFPIPFFRKGSYEFQILFRNYYLLFLFLVLFSIGGMIHKNPNILYVSFYLQNLFIGFSLINPDKILYIRNYLSTKSFYCEKICNIVFNISVLSVIYLLISLSGGTGVFGRTLFIFFSSILLCTSFYFLKYLLNQNPIITFIIGSVSLLPLSIYAVMVPEVFAGFLLISAILTGATIPKLQRIFSYGQHTKVK